MPGEKELQEQQEEKSGLYFAWRSIIPGERPRPADLSDVCAKKRKNITGHASPSVFVFCRQEIYLKVKIASISHLTFLWGESALKKVNGLFQTKNRRNIQKKRLYNGEAIDIWDLLTLFGI